MADVLFVIFGRLVDELKMMPGTGVEGAPCARGPTRFNNHRFVAISWQTGEVENDHPGSGLVPCLLCSLSCIIIVIIIHCN